MNKETFAIGEKLDSIINHPFLVVFENKVLKYDVSLKKEIIDGDHIKVSLSKVLFSGDNKTTICHDFTFRHSVSETDWKDGLERSLSELLKIEQLKCSL